MVEEQVMGEKADSYAKMIIPLGFFFGYLVFGSGRLVNIALVNSEKDIDLT